MALGGFFGGSFGAAAGGAVQGQDDYQRQIANKQAMQMNQLRLQQAHEQQVRDAATANAQRAATEAFQKTMQSAFGTPGRPQAPAPGTPSVPMQQPAAAAPAAPAGSMPAQLPPYRALQAGQPAPMPGQVQLPPRPQPVPQPQAMPSQAAQQLTMQSIQANAPSDPDAYRLYMEQIAPYMAAKGEWSQPYELNGAIVQSNAKTGEVRSVVRGAVDKGDWSDPYTLDGATVQKNTKTGQVRKVTGPPGGGAGGAGNLGHLNAFKARETKDLAPITDAQMKTAKIRALLQSGNAVGTAQVQQALSDLYSHLRATNQIYADNKNFGNIEQRFAGALNRFISGKYSADDRKMIVDLVSEMDSKVFSPARKNVVDRYKKQAKTFGYDPDVADEPNAFAPAAAAESKSSSTPPVPAGFTVLD